MNISPDKLDKLRDTYIARVTKILHQIYTFGFNSTLHTIMYQYSSKHVLYILL